MNLRLWSQIAVPAMQYFDLREKYAEPSRAGHSSRSHPVQSMKPTHSANPDDCYTIPYLGILLHRRPPDRFAGKLHQCLNIYIRQHVDRSFDIAQALRDSEVATPTPHVDRK